MDQAQRTRLEEQEREVLREIEEIAMAMWRGSNAPGDAGLFFSFYSQEAEALRRRQKILLQRLVILSNILQTEQPKTEENKK